MHPSKTLLATLLASTLLATGCSGSQAYKYRYDSADFGMGYLKAENNAKMDEMLAERVSNELKAFDATLGKLDELTKPLPEMVQGQVKGHVDAIKGQVAVAIKPKILAATKSSAEELAKFLSAHDVFAAKDHPFGYNLIDKVAGDDADAKEANKLIDEANAVLKEAYKVTATVALAKRMVELTKADLAELKASPSAAKVAGIGLITVSVTRGTLTSVSQAQMLVPKVQGVLEKAKDALAAKPMLAMKIGGLPGQLGGAAGGLASVASDAPGLLGGVAGLAEELTKL